MTFSNFYKKTAPVLLILAALGFFYLSQTSPARAGNPSGNVSFNIPKSQGGGAGDLPGEDLSIQDVFNIINGIACWLTRVAGAVIVIFLVFVALKFMNARGNPTKVAEARKSLYHVFMGMLVIMGVYVIIATVANFVGVEFSYIFLKC